MLRALLEDHDIKVASGKTRNGNSLASKQEQILDDPNNLL